MPSTTADATGAGRASLVSTKYCVGSARGFKKEHDSNAIGSSASR